MSRATHRGTAECDHRLGREDTPGPSGHAFGSRCKGTARPDSDVDLALTMRKGHWERRFKNYRDNVNAWERELTDVVGITVFVRSLHPALGPEVPAAVKECSIKLWQRA